MHSNKFIFRLFLTIFIFLLGLGGINHTKGQNVKKFNKYLDKAEQNYASNKFEKAIKFADKLKVKANSKLGVNNQFTAVANLKKAKYQWALGNFNEFYSLNEEGIAASKAINGPESLGHAVNLKDAAVNMLHYGNYKKANAYLSAALTIFENNELVEKAYLAEVRLLEAEILIGLGLNNKALQLINSNETFFLQQATNAEKEKIGKQEKEQRKQQIARLITLKSNALRHKGAYLSADSAFVYGENWIKENVGKRSKEFSNHLYYFAEMLEENGTHELPASYYSDAYVYAMSAYGEIHPFTLRNLERLTVYSIKEGNSNKASAYFNTLQKSIKANFSKESTHYVKLASISYQIELREGDIKKTAESVNKLLLDVKQIPLDHPERIALYEILITVAGAKNQYVLIEKYLEAILKVQATLYGENAATYAFTKIRLANHYIDHTDKLQLAAEIYAAYYEEGIKKQITTGHYFYVDIINHIAKNYQFNDQYNKASKILDEALFLTRVKYDNKDINFGKELNLIAELQIKIGEYDKAEANINEALGILENYNNDVDIIYYVKALETNAKLLSVKGLYDEAQNNIEKAQKLFKGAIPSNDYNPLSAAQELAGVYLKIGEYSAAEEIIQESLSNNKKLYGEESQKLIPVLVDKAKLELIKGDYTATEQYGRAALNISQKIFGKLSTKNTPAILVLGELYETIGDYERAEESYQQAIELLEKQFGRTHVDVAMAISRLAIAKFRGGDKDTKEIEALLLESKNIIGKQFTVLSPLYADILKDLSIFFISQGKLEDAMSFLNQSQQIWETKAGRRNNIKAADIHILRGDVFYRQYKYRDAEKEYRASQKLNEKFFNKQHPEYVKATSRLSKVYYMDGDYKNAKAYIEEVIENYGGFIENYFPALSEREKTKYWNTIRADFDFYTTMALKLHKNHPEMIETVYNNTLKTKGLLLSSSIKMRQRILSSPDTVLRMQYFTWLEKKEQLSKAISMNSEQMSSLGINLSDLAKEVEKIEKELSQKSELFSKDFDNQEFTWLDIKNKLQPNEVAIEMVRYQYFDRFPTDSIIYVMLILKNEKKSKPTFVVLDNGNQLESKYFNNYRNSIKYRITDKYSYNQYWKPIEAAVGRNATIFLSPDGVFNQINLEAIPLDSGRYLIDNSNIILIGNTKELVKHQEKNVGLDEEKIALLFGDPKFYMASKSEYISEFRSGAAQVNELPGTRIEIEAISKLFKANGWQTQDYLEMYATEGEVKEIQSPRVFHIATHGFFSEEKEERSGHGNMKEISTGNNPLMKSGLMLRGAGDVLAKTKYNFNIEPGILTAYEAMNLNLDQTELVVLSACETGLGVVQSGEGVYGLQRSFLVAGAKTLIMSLFKVSDEATQKLMVNFYKKWLETGNKRQAFIDAKKELRNEYNDPIYWGAFVMIGLE